MARFSFRLPDIGEGISEAEIVAWHVAVGDRVEEDQQIADMMTDKATVEMESPVSGTVLELAGEVGDQVAIGSTLVVIETEGDAAEDDEVVAENPGVEEASDAQAACPTPEEDARIREEAKTAGLGEPEKPSPLQGRGSGEGQSQAPSVETAPLPGPLPGGQREQKVLASPAVRARAKELGVDLAQVKADGGHVRHADLDAFLRYGTAQGYHAPHASRAREDEAVKVIGMRRRIAENMAASKRAISST